MTKRTAIAEMFNPGRPKQAIPGRVHVLAGDEPDKEESTLSARQAYQRKYYLKNRAKLLKQKSAWQKANHDIVNAQRRRYYAQNRERISTKQRERYQREKGKP